VPDAGLPSTFSGLDGDAWVDGFHGSRLFQKEGRVKVSGSGRLPGLLAPLRKMFLGAPTCRRGGEGWEKCRVIGDQRAVEEKRDPAAPGRPAAAEVGPPGKTTEGL
jgi:hypothetical protein